MRSGIACGRVRSRALPLTMVLLVLLALPLLVGTTPASAGPLAAQADELLAGPAGQQAKLTAADGGAFDWLGCSVTIDGDTAVVGAYAHSVGANEAQGSAYVYVRSGTTWTQQAQLIATDGAANDFFGYSVALSGDTAVVGAPYDNVGANMDQGSAYVFVRSGTTWSQQAKLTASDGANWDQLGCSVALSGDTAVVGAEQDDVGDGYLWGSAYVFVRSGTTWSQQTQLTATDGAPGDRFGKSVALSGETAVVGAYADDVGANAEQGSAYVFVRSGTTWSQQAQLIAAGGAANDWFGCSVALSGDTAVVGASEDDFYQGSAFVFVRSGATWSEQQKLTAYDGRLGNHCGNSVAVSGETAVVSASHQGDDAQGSAYVFARSGTTWSQQAQLTAADRAGGDRFGYSVALSGETAVVGAYADDVGANEAQGSAYVFGNLPAKPVPSSPKGLISSRTPTFRWRVAAGAVTYQVRVYKGARLIRKNTGITKLSWKCTRPLPRGVWLTWKVRAVNAAGLGAWSGRLRFRVR